MQDAASGCCLPALHEAGTHREAEAMTWRLAMFAFGLVWGALLLSPGSATPLKQAAIIDITQTQIKQSGSTAKFPGADVRWVYSLHNRRITLAAIGYSILNCTFIGSGGQFGSEGVYQCSAIYALKKGKIVAAGILKRRSYYALAITGGTGIYSNFGGQVLVSTIREVPHEEKLLFGLET